MATKYEFYDVGWGAFIAITDPNWKAQSFTPQISHIIRSVRLQLAKQIVPGTITISIRLADANHHPTGLDLAIGTTDGNTLPFVPGNEWREILLTPYHLEAFTEYCIVARSETTNGIWLAAFMTGTYPRGQSSVSLNGGVTWADGTQPTDYMFEEWGDPAPVVVAPTVTTNPATLISQVSATLNGTLAADGGEACECGFEWGLTDAYGHTTLTESKVTGESFSRAIHGLFPGFTYHFRAFATNSAGTGYGADRSFTSTPTFNRAHALSREEL